MMHLFCLLSERSGDQRSRLLSVTLEICLSGLSLALEVGYFGTVHLSSNLSSPAEECFRPCCLVCGIL